MSINQLACVSAALFDSRKMCLHQSFSSVLGRKVPPKNHRTNWSTTPRTGTACSSPSTSQAPFIQLITTLLYPRTSKRRCVSDGHATFQRSLSSRGLFERSTKKSQALGDSGGFKFNITCQECSNSFVSPCVTGLQLRYPGVTQETREWALPVIRSARKRTFPLRAVAIVLLGQFDVLVPPHFVAALRHRFFPVSATFRITRTAHHLPSGNAHPSAFSAAEPL